MKKTKVEIGMLVRSNGALGALGYGMVTEIDPMFLNWQEKTYYRIYWFRDGVTLGGYEEKYVWVLHHNTLDLKKKKQRNSNANNW